MRESTLLEALGASLGQAGSENKGAMLEENTKFEERRCTKPRVACRECTEKTCGRTRYFLHISVQVHFKTSEGTPKNQIFTQIATNLTNFKEPYLDELNELEGET